LNEDRDLAAQKYETIRLRLTKIFYARGCQTAEELADDTIDRVTKKVDSIAENYEGDPSLYFYAVAKNVFLEFTRKPAPNELPGNLREQNRSNQDELEIRDRCLEKCLKKLPNKQNTFILKYYESDKKEKIENRKEMMQELDLSAQNLRVRAYRIRDRLQKCLFKCLEKNSETF
jgi:RNA polymerase sigma factor (sigma-70 family)